jgi:hypothetical protein
MSSQPARSSESRSSMCGGASAYESLGIDNGLDHGRGINRVPGVRDAASREILGGRNDVG